MKEKMQKNSNKLSHTRPGAPLCKALLLNHVLCMDGLKSASVE